MAGVGEALGVIGLVSLFSTCVECFGYFRASQRMERDCDILMVKLDIEKTRLLVWGTTIGLFNNDAVQSRNTVFDDPSTVTLLDRCLRNIESLLTDTEKLTKMYGVTTYSSPIDREITFVSSSSMTLFQTACRRFWGRHASTMSKPTLSSRTKWGIYKKETFQGFINDLKDLIDGLYQIAPVPREGVDSVIEADIGSLTNVDQLRLVEAATENSYRAWSAVASSTIETSEMGTTDRRNIEERLMDLPLETVISKNESGKSLYPKLL